MDKKEFGYVAQLSEEKEVPKLVPDKSALSVHEREIMNRVLDKIKLNSAQWAEFSKDMREGETKLVLCSKYGIKPAQLKWIKRYMRGIK